MPGALRCQNMASNALEFELQVDVSYHVGTQNGA